MNGWQNLINVYTQEQHCFLWHGCCIGKCKGKCKRGTKSARTLDIPRRGSCPFSRWNPTTKEKRPGQRAALALRTNLPTSVDIHFNATQIFCVDFELIVSNGYNQQSVVLFIFYIYIYNFIDTSLGDDLSCSRFFSFGEGAKREWQTKTMKKGLGASVCVRASKCGWTRCDVEVKQPYQSSHTVYIFREERRVRLSHTVVKLNQYNACNPTNTPTVSCSWTMNNVFE